MKEELDWSEKIKQHWKEDKKKRGRNKKQGELKKTKIIMKIRSIVISKTIGMSITRMRPLED